MLTTAPGYICHTQAVQDMILAHHTRPDGTLDVPGLVHTAVVLRRQVQALEAKVNAGDVVPDVRERLAIMQGRDIDHRRLLSEQVPGWDDALSWARKKWPAAKRAKAMQRAAQRLGVWPS